MTITVTPASFFAFVEPLLPAAGVRAGVHAVTESP